MERTKVCGILFRKSIRASYASCDLVVPGRNEDERDEHIIVLIQFETNKKGDTRNDDNDNFTTHHENGTDDATSIRSYIRRTLQLGHELTFYGGNWLTPTSKDDDSHENEEKKKHGRVRRWEMIWRSTHDDRSTGSGTDTCSRMDCSLERKWSMSTCQKVRSQFYPTWEMNPPPNFWNRSAGLAKATSTTANTASSMKQRKQKACQGQTGHGGGIGKRQQGHVLAEFIIYLYSQTQPSFTVPTFHTNTNTACTSEQDKENRNKAIQKLSQGRGILDIAGGSGHVSMAFSLLQIPSTVIDPRSNVGKLPQRDRKIYKRALLKQPHLQKYSSYRAWFATKPPGVDVSFRQQSQHKNDTQQLLQTQDDDQDIPILCCQPCNDNNDTMMKQASAVVALHPDEATEAIVDVCVQYQKPFVVVPCCVFSRLFPHRSHITTYLQFIDYLQSKHSSIQKTYLENFEGANIALWSTFS